MPVFVSSALGFVRPILHSNPEPRTHPGSLNSPGLKPLITCKHVMGLEVFQPQSAPSRHYTPKAVHSNPDWSTPTLNDMVSFKQEGYIAWASFPSTRCSSYLTRTQNLPMHLMWGLGTFFEHRKTLNHKHPTPQP